MYLENRVSAAPTVVKNPSRVPSGRSSFVSAHGERLRRRQIEEVEEIPAQNAVDRTVLVLQARLQVFGERCFRVLRITIEIGEQIFEDDLAAEALAEERDVRADDRPEVHQDRRFARRQGRQEFSQRLGGKRSGRRLRARRPEPPRRFVLCCANPRATSPPFVPAEAAAEPRAGAPPAASLRPGAGLRRPCPSAPCRRCRGSARLRQWPRAAT